MQHTIPRAVRDLQGDLWLARETADLLEAVLQESTHPDPQVMRELQSLLRLPSGRQIASARDQLGIPDPRAARISRNVVKG
jgi:hypothetical protein